GEFADLMLGYYGSTLGEKNAEVLKKAEAQAKKTPITVRPADLLKPEWEHLRSDALALEGCNGSDEDVLTYAMFPQVAPKFFKTRAAGPKNLGKEPGVLASAAVPTPHPPDAKPPLQEKVQYVVTLNGQEHKVTVSPAA